MSGCVPVSLNIIQHNVYNINDYLIHFYHICMKHRVPEHEYSLWLWWRNVGSCHLRGLTNRYLSVTVRSWLAKMVIRLFNDLHLLEIYEAVKSGWDARLVRLARTDCWLSESYFYETAQRPSHPPYVGGWYGCPAYLTVSLMCRQPRQRSPSPGLAWCERSGGSS